MRKTIPLLLTSLLMLTFIAGCGGDSFTPSKNVEFLWQQHPMPFTPESAEAAASDAAGLLAKHPKDLQLELYYIDRMSDVDYDSLVDIYQAKLAKKPGDPRFMLLEAVAVGGRNRMVDSLRVALEKAPEDPYILSFTSQALLRSRPADPELALSYAKKAVELAPDLGYAHSALTAALLENGKLEESLAAGEMALALMPWSYDIVRMRAVALEELGRGEEGLEMIEAFAEVQPLNPILLYDLERRYSELGTLEKIVDLKVNAAEANPQDGWAWLDVATLYQELDRVDESVGAYRKAMENDFYDLDLILHEMTPEVSAVLKNNADWKTLKAEMVAKREDTRDERKTDALAEWLDKPAPDFSALTLAGKEVSLSDLRGKVVVLDFWSTWCPPCKLTIPRLKDLYNSGVDVQIVSVDVWERVPEDQRPGYVGEFAKGEGMKWNVWLAPNTAADAYEVRGIPTFVVIDPEGVIRYISVGYRPFLDEVLGWMIESARTGGDVMG